MATPPRILIVDDDPIIPRLLSKMLNEKGYVIAGIVTSGEEAVVKSAEMKPDLVIIDINLSGKMDSIDAAHFIFQLFHCPIIFITGDSEEGKLDRLKYSRPYGIIFKPFTALEITTCVDLAIHNHTRRVGNPDRFPAGDPKKIMDALEAYIITDKRGRIIFFNTYAGWFIDLPPSKILMKHWRDVLMFINEVTGEPIKDPVTEAANQMAGVVYKSNTAAVTTTSKRRKVTVAVRPVKDDHDNLIAVLMTIKEKTQTNFS
ncbi:MAG: response regulator [Methanoregula sp.]|jgi:CheY-like chemotaxis protein|nr:response regulator [Methanoregula sp.]